MNILIVVHTSPFSKRDMGGAEHLFLKLIQQKQAQNIRFFCLWPMISEREVIWEVHDMSVKVGQFSESRVSANPINFGNEAFSHWFASTLVSLNIDLVHVFHQMWKPLTIISIARSFGVRTIITFHDYFHICDSFNLLNDADQYCNILETRDSRDCISCARKRTGNPTVLPLLRSAMLNLLEQVDVIIVGSEFVKDSTKRFYGVGGDKIVVVLPIIHPVNLPDFQSETKRVLILGNFTRPKGAELILRALKLPELQDYKFEHAGRIDFKFEKDLRHHENLGRLNILGQYQFGQLPKSKAKVALFASIWPETYCITSDEALWMKKMIVVPFIGAFIEKFSNEPNAYFYKPGDSSSMASAIARADSSEFIEPIRGLGNGHSFVQSSLDLYKAIVGQVGVRKEIPKLSQTSWTLPNAELLGFYVHNPISNFSFPISRRQKLISMIKTSGLFPTFVWLISYLYRKLK